MPHHCLRNWVNVDILMMQLVYNYMFHNFIWYGSLWPHLKICSHMLSTAIFRCKPHFYYSCLNSYLSNILSVLTFVEGFFLMRKFNYILIRICISGTSSVSFLLVIYVTMVLILFAMHYYACWKKWQCFMSNDDTDNK